MQCPDCIDHLYDYLDDELDQETRLVLKEHLRVCPTCQAELRGIQQGLSVYREEIASVEVSLGFAERVMASVARESEFAPGTAPMMAIGLLIITLAVIYTSFSPLLYPLLRLLYRFAVSLAPLPVMVLSAFPLLLYGGIAVFTVAFLTFTWAARRVVLS